MVLNARIQSENDAARLCLDTFEAITRRAMNGDLGNYAVIQSLKDNYEIKKTETRMPPERPMMRETEVDCRGA